ncbi:unnamed protein product, partial [Polarella glacialis]
ADFLASLFEKLARSRLGRDVSVAETDPPCLAGRTFWQASLRSLPGHGLAVTADFLASLFEKLARSRLGRDVSVAGTVPLFEKLARSQFAAFLASLFEKLARSRLGRDVSVAETGPLCLAGRTFWQASLRSLPGHGLAVTADFLASLFEKLARSRLGRDVSLLQRLIRPAWDFLASLFEKLARSRLGRDVSVAETDPPCLAGRTFWQASLRSLPGHGLGRDVSVAETDPPCLAGRTFWQASLRSLPGHGLAVTSLLQRLIRPAWQGGTYVYHECCSAA